MTARRYNLLVAMLLAPVVTLLAVTGTGLDPYFGDLTRLGGYSEGQYGWNDPQQRFAPPLYRLTATERFDYPAATDVVILGDSFTIDSGASWPNYVVQHTGLRVEAFRNDKVTLEAALASRNFRDRPPRVLIYQIVERNLIGLPTASGGPCTPQAPPRAAALRTRPIDVATAPYHRPRDGAWINPSLAIDFLAKTVAREYLRRDRTRVVRLALAAEAPLSSAERRSLLVYQDDVRKLSWSAQDWEDIRCRLIDAQNRVQANGQTFFVALVAPDKLTAFANLLHDERYAGASRIDLLTADRRLHLPRLDLRLRQAIRDGVVDVYLGNDTHWGSAGYELAGRAVVDFLDESGVLERSAR